MGRDYGFIGARVASFVLAVVAVLNLSSCSDDAGTAPIFDGVDDASDGGDANGSDGFDLGCRLLPPPGDSDGDGLLDIIEDANRNCVVDPGETDPFNADTDGDGVLDGEEDVDQNGVWNAARGETNPRSRDSDSNGIEDGDELVSIACRHRAVREMLTQRASIPGGATIFLPNSYQDFAIINDRLLALRNESEDRGRYGVFVPHSAAQSEVQDLVDSFFLAEPNGLHATWLGERSTASGQWIARLRVDAAKPLSANDLLQLVARNAWPDIEPDEPLDSTWSDSKREISVGYAQIAWLSRGDESVLAVAMSTAPGDEQWFRQIHPRALAPTADSRLRIQCAEVRRAEHGASTLHVVVPERILVDGVAARALASVHHLLEDEQLSAVVVHTVSADSERAVAPEIEPRIEPEIFASAESFGEWLESVYVEREDELIPVNVWAAVVAVGEQSTVEPPSDESRIVLVASDQESREFLGFEQGSAMLDREARLKVLTGTVDSDDIELIAAAPPRRDATGFCGERQLPGGSANESSFRTMARRLGFSFAYPCSDEGARLLDEQLREVLLSAPFLGVSRSPIWGSAMLTNRGFQTASARFNERNGTVVVSSDSTISGDQAGLSFTFWETPEMTP